MTLAKGWKSKWLYAFGGIPPVAPKMVKAAECINFIRILNNNYTLRPIEWRAKR